MNSLDEIESVFTQTRKQSAGDLERAVAGLSYSPGFPTAPHGVAISEGDPMKCGLLAQGILWCEH